MIQTRDKTQDDLGPLLSLIYHQLFVHIPTLFKWLKTFRNWPQISATALKPFIWPVLKRLDRNHLRDWALNECLCTVCNEWAPELIRRWFVCSVLASRPTIFRLELQQHAREANNGGGQRMWLKECDLKASKHTSFRDDLLLVFILGIFLSWKLSSRNNENCHYLLSPPFTPLCI